MYEIETYKCKDCHIDKPTYEFMEHDDIGDEKLCDDCFLLTFTPEERAQQIKFFNGFCNYIIEMAELEIQINKWSINMVCLYKTNQLLLALGKYVKIVCKKGYPINIIRLYNLENIKTKNEIIIKITKFAIDDTLDIINTYIKKLDPNKHSHIYNICQDIIKLLGEETTIPIILKHAGRL